MAAQDPADELVYDADEPPDHATHAALADGAVLAHLDRPTAAERARVAVVSDPHVADPDAKESWKAYHRTRERVTAALDDLAEAGVDALVVSGDLSRNGEPKNLAWMADALADAPFPTLAVPGNHDVAERPVEQFADAFASEGFPAHRRVGGVDLVGLDTSDGDATDLGALDDTLADATAPIVVSHHNLPGLAAHLDDGGWEPHPPVGNADALVDALARRDAALHVSGHVHLPGVVHARGVRGLVAPALSSFPQAYLVLDVGPDGTTVRCHAAADRDGTAEAYRLARDHSTRSHRIATHTAARLTSLPIVDDREDETVDASASTR